MQVVGLRSSSFHEEKRDVGNGAVICEILEGIGPEKDTDPSEYLEDKTNCKKDSTGQEVE